MVQGGIKRFSAVVPLRGAKDIREAQRGMKRKKRGREEELREEIREERRKGGRDAYTSDNNRQQKRKLERERV